MKSQLPSHQTGIQNSSANVNVQVRPNILLKALETATTKGELISECIYDILNYVASNAHCVLLEHYYSVDFQWLFDRKNCFTKISNEMMKFFSVKWQKLKLHFVISHKNCLCLTLLDEKIFKSFWKPTNSQLHGWICKK